MRASATSVFGYVLIGTYIGVGALAHDFGFSLPWVMLSTLLVWVGPGQVILISALGGGAPYCGGRDRGRFEQRAAVSHGRDAPAAHQDAGDALP